MKKSTLSMLILGTLLIGTGTVGAAIYETSAKEAVSYDVSTSFSYHDDELTIKNLPVDAGYQLQLVQSNSSKIKLSGELDTLYTKNAPKMSLDDDTLSFESVDFSKTKKVSSFFSSFLFSRGYNDTLTLEIPANIKKVTLDQAGMSIYNLNLEELTLKNAKKYTDLSDLHVKKLNLAGNRTVYLNNVRADEMNITSGNQEVNIDYSLINKLDYSGQNTTLGLQNVKIKEATGELLDGSISLTSFSGNLKLNGTNTNLHLGEDIAANLDVDLESGSIDQNGSIYDAPESTSIKATTDLGDLVLFGQKNGTYGKKNAKYRWNLKVAMGDISLGSYSDEPEEDDDDDNLPADVEESSDNHHEDMMDEMEDMMDDDDYQDF